MKRLLLLVPLIHIGLFGLVRGLASAQSRRNPRLFIVVVCDGLRPDSVTQRDMPHLYNLAREGVRFDRQHSQFPTVTMVNAATLATGAPAGLPAFSATRCILAPRSPSTVRTSARNRSRPSPRSSTWRIRTRFQHWIRRTVLRVTCWGSTAWQSKWSART